MQLVIFFHLNNTNKFWYVSKRLTQTVLVRPFMIDCMFYTLFDYRRRIDKLRIVNNALLKFTIKFEQIFNMVH